MKRKIRLTESDIHRIVKESVNKVLTELDWKTYANAEREALKRSIGERPLSKAKLRKKDNSPYESFNDIRYANRRFRNAKVNAFNDTHNGAKMTKRSDEGPVFDDYDYLKTGVGPYFGNGYTDYMYKDERYKPGFLYSDADKNASEDTLNDTQEYSDYLKGNYGYQNGEGWKLKH